jgi:thiamine-phosphate pyrophosphorylase
VIRLGFSIYAVTDPDLCGADLLKAVREAIEGGAGAVQLRNKRATTRELHREAERLRELTLELGVPLFVNDRVDVALAVDADGVHLGQEDLPLRLARGIWPRPRILGVSAATAELARVAFGEGADYVGAGPVFATATKDTGRRPLGREGLRAIVEAVALPVVGIGGICVENVAQVAEAGAAVAAVIGGLFADPRGPRIAAAALLQEFERHTRGPGAIASRDVQARNLAAGGDS